MDNDTMVYGERGADLMSIAGSIAGWSKCLISSLLILMVYGCGGGSGNDSGSFTGDEPVDETGELSLTIAAENTTLPVNLNAASPSFISPFTTEVTVVVRDDQGRAAPNGTEVQMVLDGVDGGGLALLDGTDPVNPDGSIGQFQSLTNVTASGVAQFYFTSDVVPGEVTITASALDDVSGVTISSSETITVLGADRPASSLRFSGPFVEAVIANASSFGAFPADGTYSRVVSIVVTDPNGNPVLPNTPVDFFLIDSPVVGFPQQGAGSFLVAGGDGNPVEGGFQFIAGSGQFQTLGVLPGDRLVLDGTQTVLPNNLALTGVRAVESVSNQSVLLTDDEGPAFAANGGIDNGATVPYIIGRAQNATILSPAFTGINGVTNTILTYPQTLVGRTAILAACVSDAGVCTVLNTCNAQGDGCSAVFLPADTGDAVTLTVSQTELEANTTSVLEMCLRDENFTPLQGTPITYEVGTGNLGAATISVNGNTAITGSFTTGSDGCATVVVEAAGQLPNTGDIVISFDAPGVGDPVLVTVLDPGGATLDIIAEDCDIDEYLAFNQFLRPTPPESVVCNLVIQVTDDDSTLPVSDVIITASSEFTPEDETGVSPEPPIFDIEFSPQAAGGNQGVTNESGIVQVRVELRVGGETTVTFSGADSEDAFSINLPLEQFAAEIQVLSQDSQLFGGRAGLGITVFELQVRSPVTNLALPGVVVTHTLGEFNFINVTDVDYVPSFGIGSGITDETGTVTVTITFDYGVPDDEEEADYTITFFVEGGGGFELEETITFAFGTVE
ncbi:MAG: hypothetical protein ACFCBW_17570 [Candidatus Competibacterales bacterium]